jgi:hypothetical protein
MYPTLSKIQGKSQVKYKLYVLDESMNLLRKKKLRLIINDTKIIKKLPSNYILKVLLKKLQNYLNQEVRKSHQRSIDDLLHG